jgi:hypothetical protein
MSDPSAPLPAQNSTTLRPRPVTLTRTSGVRPSTDSEIVTVAVTDPSLLLTVALSTNSRLLIRLTTSTRAHGSVLILRFWEEFAKTLRDEISTRGLTPFREGSAWRVGVGLGPPAARTARGSTLGAWSVASAHRQRHGGASPPPEDDRCPVCLCPAAVSHAQRDVARAASTSPEPKNEV